MVCRLAGYLLGGGEGKKWIQNVHQLIFTPSADTLCVPRRMGTKAKNRHRRNCINLGSLDVPESMTHACTTDFIANYTFEVTDFPTLLPTTAAITMGRISIVAPLSLLFPGYRNHAGYNRPSHSPAPPICQTTELCLGSTCVSQLVSMVQVYLNFYLEQVITYCPKYLFFLQN